MRFSIDLSKDKQQPARAKTTQFCIPGNLRVSCQKADACSSSSKRLRGFVCGSNYSHDDRLERCIEYCRLCRGEQGGHLL